MGPEVDTLALSDSMKKEGEGRRLRSLDYKIETMRTRRDY